MAQELRKTVKRKTVEPVAAVRRHLIVALEPGDVIAFKEHGRRKWYRAPISRIFTQVVKWNADVEVAEKKKEKELKRYINE